MEEYKINYGNEVIVYNVIRKNVKNININIRPDTTVIISAKAGISVNKIKEIVKKKAPLILRDINYFKEAKTEVMRGNEYVSGENIRYLGKQYRLRVVKADAETVKIMRGFIYLYVQNINSLENKKNLLNNWLQVQIENVFNSVLDNVYPSVGKCGIAKPAIRIREMKARWGSCYRKRGVIVLNKELIKAPKYCIEYVVLHELLHFKYINHGTDFYDSLTILMPDWKLRKKILDEEIIRFI